MPTVTRRRSVLPVGGPVWPVNSSNAAGYEVGEALGLARPTPRQRLSPAFDRSVRARGGSPVLGQLAHAVTSAPPPTGCPDPCAGPAPTCQHRASGCGWCSRSPVWPPSLTSPRRTRPTSLRPHAVSLASLTSRVPVSSRARQRASVCARSWERPHSRRRVPTWSSAPAQLRLDLESGRACGEVELESASRAGLGGDGHPGPVGEHSCVACW
jgi:hypothetical protein